MTVRELMRILVKIPDGNTEIVLNDFMGPKLAKAERERTYHLNPAKERVVLVLKGEW